MPINELGALRIIESLYLEQDGEPYEVRRTWRERLLTRPWRPLMKVRMVIPKVPYKGAVRLNETTLVMHPAMVQELRRGAGSDYRAGLYGHSRHES